MSSAAGELLDHSPHPPALKALPFLTKLPIWLCASAKDIFNTESRFHCSYFLRIWKQESLRIDLFSFGTNF